MRFTINYTVTTGRVERTVDDSELAAVVSDLAGAGAKDITVAIGATAPPSGSSGPSAVLPPYRQIDPSSQSISLVDVRRPDRPIIYVNRGFEHLTGYSRDECIGRNCRFLQGPGTDRAVVDRIRHATRHGEDLIVDLLNYRKNGAEFWNRLSLKPVRNAAGDLTHMIGIQSDITPMLALQGKMEEWARDLGRSQVADP